MAIWCAVAVVSVAVGGRAAWRAWAARDEAAARAAHAEYVDLVDQHREAERRHRWSVVGREEWADLAETRARGGEAALARDAAREADKQRQNEDAMRAHLDELEERIRALERAWADKWARLGLPLARADDPPAGK